MTLFQLGGCEGGWLDEVRCVNIPDQLGFRLLNEAFTLIPVLSAIGFPALACYVLAEVTTRWRTRKSL